MINLHCDAVIPDGPMKNVAEIEKSITTAYKKTIWSKFLKAVNDFDMVKDGDKIAIGVSGGKDSLLLAKLFHELKKDRRRNFEFKAVSLNPGFREDDLNNFKNNLKKLMKNKKYDVVIDFDMGLSKYIKMINVNKKIAWVHASIKNWYERESRIARLGKRLQQYDNIVTICDEMKEETGNLFPFLRNKLLRIYNPFNFDRILNLSEEKVENKYYDEDFIIAISRLTTHQKDFLTLIKGFKRAKELSNIPEKLLILGDGPDREKIEKMIRDENMEKDIILLGSIKNPYPWLKKAKLFVHSSKYEGLPTVLIEALVLNKKVISSACPTGPKEILENGRIGDLYEIGDYEKLTYYIIEALKNSSLDKELIEKEIQKFSKEEVIKEYERLILN